MRAIDGDLQAVLRPVFHPAERHQVELDDITQQLRDLPLRELDEGAERARLRAARRELAGLPAKPAWTEHVPVLDEAGQLVIYGAKRQQADQAERRAWLRNAAFTVCLARPAMVTWAGDDDGDGVLSAVGAYTSEDAALIFAGPG